ncbi:MAG: DUF2080 family transposase-associated protein [Candidatus Thermoplasmatota archaeon]|nr:DUF2080 family transposase-associated protein [Candidatus Thermoplasmatota archaeon]
MNRTTPVLIMVILLFIITPNFLSPPEKARNNSIEMPNNFNHSQNSTTRSGELDNPSITTTNLPEGHVGVQYSLELEAKGGAGFYSWRIVSGKLPPGLHLSEKGIISGEPETGGRFTSGVRLSDLNESIDTKIFSVNIKAEPSTTMLIAAIAVILFAIIFLVVMAIKEERERKKKEPHILETVVEEWGKSAHFLIDKEYVGKKVKVVILKEEKDSWFKRIFPWRNRHD